MNEMNRLNELRDSAEVRHVFYSWHIYLQVIGWVLGLKAYRADVGI